MSDKQYTDGSVIEEARSYDADQMDEVDDIYIAVISKGIEEEEPQEMPAPTSAAARKALAEFENAESGKTSEQKAEDNERKKATKAYKRWAKKQKKNSEEEKEQKDKEQKRNDKQVINVSEGANPDTWQDELLDESGNVMQNEQEDSSDKTCSCDQGTCDECESRK